MRRGLRTAVAVLAMGGALLAGNGRADATTTAADVPLAWTAPRALNVPLAGTNGVSRARGEGLDCDGDQAVDDVHLLLTAPVAAGTLAATLPATANANLGLAGRRLEPTTSHASLGDERGTIQVQLDGGACPGADNLAPVAGGRLAGNGSLSLVGATGSYRSAQLSGGTWSLSTATAPGADNPWNLALAGQLAVLTPGLQVEVVGTYWGNLGLDYVTRIVTVQYRLTNPGPGDSYGTSLTGVTASPGVTPLGPLPQSLGDLLAGESRVVTLRFQLGLLQPCQLVVLGCAFSTTLTASVPDALDGAGTRSVNAGVLAPNLPPPL